MVTRTGGQHEEVAGWRLRSLGNRNLISTPTASDNHTDNMDCLATIGSQSRQVAVAWVLQERDCSGELACDCSWKPKEISGQKNQDWVPEPGGLERLEPHPYNESKLDGGPCENQLGWSPVDGGEDTTR